MPNGMPGSVCVCVCAQAVALCVFVCVFCVSFLLTSVASPFILSTRMLVTVSLCCVVTHQCRVSLCYCHACHAMCQFRVRASACQCCGRCVLSAAPGGDAAVLCSAVMQHISQLLAARDQRRHRLRRKGKCTGEPAEGRVPPVCRGT